MKILKSTKHKRSLQMLTENIHCFDRESSKIVPSKISSKPFAVISSVTDWHVSFYCNVSLQDDWGGKTVGKGESLCHGWSMMRQKLTVLRSNFRSNSDPTGHGGIAILPDHFCLHVYRKKDRIKGTHRKECQNKVEPAEGSKILSW